MQEYWIFEGKLHHIDWQYLLISIFIPSYFIVIIYGNFLIFGSGYSFKLSLFGAKALALTNQRKLEIPYPYPSPSHSLFMQQSSCIHNFLKVKHTHEVCLHYLKTNT